MRTKLSAQAGYYIALGAILALAIGLRLHGLNWDSGWYLQPDERFIAIVQTDRIREPDLRHLTDLLDPATSPLNPRSDDAEGRPRSFAYGSLPLYVVDVAAWLLGALSGRSFGDYGHIGVVGRSITAVLDTGTVLLAVFFARRAYGRAAAVVAGFLLATSVLLIQLAHFYTTDAWITFFATAALVASLELWSSRSTKWAVVAGVIIGAGLATKVSVITLAVPVIVAAIAPSVTARPWRVDSRAVRCIAAVAIGSVLSFAAFEPYALLRPQPFLDDAFTQWAIVSGRFDVPFTRQFVGTTPGVYQLKNLVIWGLGPALGLAILAGCASALWRTVRERRPADILLLVWIVPYFLVIATAEAKYLRYVAPIVPALVILASRWLVGLVHSRITRPRRTVLAVAGILVVSIATLLWALAFSAIYSAPHTRIAASRWIYQNVPPGATITSEYWDDTLPMPLPGTPGQGRYRVITLDLYADRDNEQAYAYIQQALERADYIILSSNRLAESIPRLPWRYPVTSEYYRLLESGQLGFQLVYDGTNYPRLGPLVIPDQSADESFTVYDHPQVRIFRKVEALSPADLRDRFSWALDQPWSATRERPKENLLLGEAVDAMDAASDLGWSEAVSGYQPLAIIIWLVAVAALGLATLPLTLLIFRGFSDAGWGFARLVGLIFVGYVVWISVNLDLLRFELPWIVLTAILCGLAVWAAARARAGELRQLVRSRARVIVAVEAVFVATFAFLLLLRAVNPDLWHTYYGGEKPMEMAYTSAIARSATFPPFDPWYAHGAMNYYYYGFYLVALLWKITGIPSEVAFQLSSATVGAMLASAVFSLTSTFAGAILGKDRAHSSVLGGLAGVLLVMFIGNLDAAAQVVSRQSFAVDFWQSSRAVSFAITEFPYFTLIWADLHPHAIALPVTVLLAGLAYASIQDSDVQGIRGGWLWVAVAALALGTVAVTNSWDLPLFSLVLGAALITRAVRVPHAALSVYAHALLRWLAVGAGAWLLFLPFFRRFVVLVSGISRTSHGTAPGEYVVHFGIFLGILGVAALMLSLRSRRGAPLIGPAAASAASAWIAFSAAAVAQTDVGWGLAGFAGRSLAAAALGATAAFVSSVAVGRTARLAAWAVGPPVAIVCGLVLPRFPVAGALLVVLAAAAAAWWRFRARPVAAMAALCVAAAAGVTLGADLAFVVDDLAGSQWERMNTVFKFYLEAWTLYALAATIALIWLVRQVADQRPSAPLRLIAGPLPRPKAGASTRERRGSRFSSPSLALAVSGLLILSGLAYPALATGPRLSQQMPGSPSGLTLDGLAWMRDSWIQNSVGEPVTFAGDYGAIQWLRRHADGLPVIVEASIGPYRGNGSRISAATGLPAVLGWDRHQRQQRYWPGIDQRLIDVRAIYNSPDIRLKRSLLRQYRVRYVVVGDVERYWRIQPPFAGATSNDEPYASAEGLAAFDQMLGTDLRLVYDDSGTRIYEVIPFPRVAPALGGTQP